MAREGDKYTVGEYWLDKRRDGKSPDIWQIARYAEKSRSVVYRSTKRKCLEEAKAAIHAYVEGERSKKPQTPDAAGVVPLLLNYWKEHGADAIKPGVIATSLRAFIGFMLQDEIGAQATVADLSPPVFKRFIAWRMKPHRFDVPWQGKDFPVVSKGVKGETVQRNLDDVRAALNHATNAGRIPYTPKVPSVPTKHRSPARDVRVPLQVLGMMVAYASLPIELSDGEIPADRDYRRWLLLLIATACRPEAAMKFDPRIQWKGELIDLQHPDAPRTKKRNPVVPVIEPFKPILQEWRGENHEAVRSRRTAWRTMRAALGLPAEVIPKTIRHTIATELRSRGVPAEQISGLLGHTAMSRITEVYAKYDPPYLVDAKRVLTIIFNEVLQHSESWAADHRRTKTGNNRAIVVVRDSQKV
ncbi:tyrosine-type recombinase/integrase [Sphingomonas olei]|uniref:Integrase n=1 Tax=Sphingomonas olei TaxID=1886787 RepID=A0ABY2QI62_9SPHN|nr:tyrosine-type recombinase/integrase [Sphingomonas olei]THG39461.1 integrase [Sphingomonas olei]